MKLKNTHYRNQNTITSMYDVPNLTTYIHEEKKLLEINLNTN